MKSIILVFFLTLLLVGLIMPGCTIQIYKIRVATDANWPPFEYVNEKTKQLAGFDIDLMNEIAKKAGLRIEFVNVNFTQLLAGMEKCQYDAAISSITITDERKKLMDFSDPYIIAGQVVVVRKDNADISSKDDLGSKQVGAEVNTTGAMEVGKIRNATLKTYPKIALAYQDLMDKRIDAVVADNPVALAYAGKNPDTLKIVGTVFTSEYYGIAVCKTNKELLAKINTGLKMCLNEKLIDKLIDKWLINQR
jgi:polar amino acid transport system substrate-binding protein